MQRPFLSAFTAEIRLSHEEIQLKSRTIDFNFEVSQREEAYSRNVDNFIAKRGLRPIKWARCTFILTIIFTVMVIISSMARTDSMNVTVCALGIYLLMNTREVKKQSFRMLVVGLCMSLVYDLVWQFMKDGAEGQLEKNLEETWV